MAADERSAASYGASLTGKTHIDRLSERCEITPRGSQLPFLGLTVSAVLTSGGGRTGSAGGKGAEAFGNIGFQLRLVVFHRKQVTAASIADSLADFALAKYGVTRNDRSLQWQLFEERKRRRDFVLARFHHHIANDRGQSRGKG